MSARPLFAKLRGATLKVTSLTFLGILLGLGVDMAVTGRLGASPAADALFVAIGLPRFLDTIVRGALRSSLVPYTLERRKALSGSAFARLVSGLLGGALSLGMALGLGLYLAAPQLAGWIGPGLESAARDDVARFLRWTVPFVVLAPAATYLESLSNSGRNFALAASRTAIVAMIVLAFAAVGWVRDDFGLWVVLGYDAGMLCSVLLLSKGLKTLDAPLRIALPPLDELRGLGATIGPPSLGFVARQVSRLVERALASLAGPGSVTAFAVAFRLFSGLQTLVGIPVATVALPELSDASLDGQRAELARRLRTNVVRVLAIGILGGGLVLLLRTQIVGLLFERGSFDAEAVQRASSLLGIMAAAIPFSCSVPVLYSGLYAERRLKRIAGNMIFIASFDIALAVFLQRTMGLNGVAVAVAASACLAAVSVSLHLRSVGVRIFGRSG